MHTLDIAPLRSESPPQKRSGMTRVVKDFTVFRLDALALSVIATATWLGGWLGGCHTPVLYQTG